MTTAYRIANHDTPFWVSPNRSAGRYNRAFEGATQYLSLHPLGCAAEYLRGQDLRTIELARERLIRIWVVEVDLGGSAILDFDQASTHGLDPWDLVSDDEGACREWAAALRTRSEAAATWVVPSAALPGTDNIVIFGERVIAPFHSPPIDAAVDLPATIVGDLSLVPAVMLAQTRFRGDPHVAYDAWRRGEPFEYREPPDYPFPAWTRPI